MKPKKIYMVGIGGIGMSALAQLYLHEGIEVVGSDRSSQPTTALLQEKGIVVLIGTSASNVPEDADVLVYSAAVPSDNPERIRGRELGIPELNYVEALSRAVEGKRVITVSGTHGKTTTTAMLGQILIDAGEDPTVVVGSIVSAWESNFHAGKSPGRAGDLCVIEACEYRGHFLNFRPSVFVITNIELDHTDYYKDLAHIQYTFKEAVGNVTSGGTVVCNAEDATVIPALSGSSSDIVDYAKESIPELLLPGEFNRDNARAAKAAVHVIAPHIKDAVIDQSLAAFRGTWRRFEYKGVLPNGAALYDDYAHHPTAIKKTLGAAREKFPDKKIVVFFHPHLYSRTRDLFEDFGCELAAADYTYILPIFSAREEPIRGVTNESLAEEVIEHDGHAAALSNMEEATVLLQTLGPDTVAFTMGAGDVYKAGEEALK